MILRGKIHSIAGDGLWVSLDPGTRLGFAPYHLSDHRVHDLGVGCRIYCRHIHSGDDLVLVNVRHDKRWIPLEEYNKRKTKKQLHRG